MIHYKAPSLARVYNDIVYDLLNQPEYISSPRGEQINENLNVVFEITNPLENLFLNSVRSPNMKYLKDELDLYFRGINSADEFAKASKFWNKLKNDDNTVNSAYGHLIFNKVNKFNYTQWRWATESLISDKDTRQSFMHFNSPDHQFAGNMDQVCTLNMLFNIRDNELNATVMMRSSDIYFGITYDVPFFTILMECMRLNLIKYSPSKFSDLKLGTYTHHSVSMHLYERNMDEMTEMMKNAIVSDGTPLLVESPIDLIGNFKGYEDDFFGHWIQNK